MEPSPVVAAQSASIALPFWAAALLTMVLFAALGAVLGEGRVRTRDLGGTAGTIEFAEAISRRVAA